MKKIFTLFGAVLLSMAAFAQVDQTFQFVDLQGNVVADGTVITVNTINEDGQMVVPLTVRNTSGQKAAVSMYEVIDQKPNGDWQTCAFGNCMVLFQSGYSPKNVVAADYDQSIETEWIPIEGEYAAWETTLQIHVFNIVTKMQFGQVIETAGDDIIGYGPKVTVRFDYRDPAHISHAEAQTAAAGACFTLAGRKTDGMRRGLNIVRMTDGTVRKVLMK